MSASTGKASACSRPLPPRTGVGGASWLVIVLIVGALACARTWVSAQESTATTQSATTGATTGAAATGTAPAAFVGPQICQACHFDRYESYENSPHGLTGDPRSPASRNACETCHGPGGQHVAGGGGREVGGMVTLDREKMSPSAINEVCLTCHSRGIVALWPGSVHESRDLACTNCHAIHGGNERLLKAESQPSTCIECHRQIRAQLMRPSHHPIREGKLVCADCHNPHGTTAERLISATTINEKCYECHAEKRGPFLWEHPPVRESCLSCHEAHGSTHEPLLTVKRPLLCQRCHSAVGHPSVLWTRTEEEAAAGQTAFETRRFFGQSAQKLFMRSCTNCHVNLHGSNHPSGKLFHR